ncbi:putative late blight resistance protein homolog R1B-14 [Andrographis paniculata]|uniref:putative late blight resistance protein homolog R1B-14 n=1 Tax=Andrographis paniculata TaxID=175694 RepID=UPI0021E7BF11|nr:putative late blight resistance protein homolog R1B-14 [Andrographis paniculata]
MAYNLNSLINLLEQILRLEDHNHHFTILDRIKKLEIESLLEKTRSLQEHSQNPSLPLRESLQKFDNRIRVAAHDAEDIIESHLTSKHLSTKDKTIIVSSLDNLSKIIEEFDVIKEEIMKIIEGVDRSKGTFFSSSREDLNPKNIVVGINNDLFELKHRLIAMQHSKFDLVSILGMGGIGKTTLARTLYDDPSIVSHFDVRAWIAISQTYDVRGILIGLMKCVVGKEVVVEEKDRLSLHLYKTLWGRRYLIVLDDMWSCEAWDDIRTSFPIEENGSRILVTTREQSVANYLGLKTSHHQMKFLNEVESWDLLRRKVFGEEEICVPNLNEIGYKIARNCGGLPLAIHVVGGILSQLERVEESWTQIANDVSAAVINSNDHISRILSLSYDHLPSHLKPCFLYMATFPEDREVRAFKLITLWVAEGFLKPIAGKTLEDAAKVYLKSLVDRNLVMVFQQELKGKAKSYIMHDLLRDLCIRKSYDENFIGVMTGSSSESYNEGNDPIRRLRVSSSDNIKFITKSPALAKVARSIFLSILPRTPYKIVGRFCWLDLSELRLLKILDIFEIQLPDFDEQIEKLVNLRYLAFSCRHIECPETLSCLRSLQTLVINWKTMVYPMRYILFDMPGLKHLKFKGDYPRCVIVKGERIVLREMETLSTVIVDDAFPAILEVIPKLKKLGMYKREDTAISTNLDLTCLRKLETLKYKCSFHDWQQKASPLLSIVTLPSSLQKLTLAGCRIPSGYIERIGARSSLRILKLQWCTFEDHVWEPSEGAFCELRLLVIEWLGFTKWIANKAHYPRLERLVVRECNLLEEIPCEVGDILTLEMIEVYGSSSSAIESARKIKEEQMELGNEALQVCIYPRLVE